MEILTQPIVAFAIVAALIVSVSIFSKIYMKRKRIYSEQYLADHTEAFDSFTGDLRRFKTLASAGDGIDEYLRQSFTILHDRIDEQVGEDMHNQLRGKLRTDDELIIIDRKRVLIHMQMEINIILLKGFVD